ncbi:MAG: M20 family metallopeptidase [Candidatus Heimdallarchaeaceae archaeon]
MNEIKEKEVIPILQKLIQFKTVNPPGKTINAINYVKKILSEKGIQCEIQKYSEDRANLFAEYGSGKESIVLCGHIDVVPPGDEKKWTFNPFEGIEHNGRIYGRGATDMKGSIASYIAILLKLKEKNIKLTKKIKLLITSDEEVGMGGAKAALNTDIMDSTHFLIIGEPTELKLSIAQKGVYWAKIKVYGKSAHGSTPELGVNAIEKAAELIAKIKKTIPSTKHPLLNYSTLNIGKISGGTSFNVVPEYCEFTLDYRVVPSVDYNEIRMKINRVLDQFNSKEDARAEFEEVHVIPPIESNSEIAFLDKLKEKLKEKGILEVIGVTYGTDGAVLVPPNNTDFVIFGPGRLDKLHVTDEYTLKDEVVTYSNLLFKTIVELFKEK